MEGFPARFARNPYGVAVYRPSGRPPVLGGTVFPGLILIAELL